MKLFEQYRGLRRENYILFFGRVVTNLGAMVWPMLTMILREKLGMSASAVAWFSLAATFVMIPASLLGGRLADRYSKKWCIVVCDAVSVLFFFICAAIPLSTASIVLMILGGAFQSMEGPAYSALIADINPTRDRDRAYSLQYLGGNLGLVLSPTIAGILFKRYLWLSFLISGLSIACSTLLIALRVVDTAPEKESGEGGEYQCSRAGESLLSILRANRTVLLYTLALGLYFSAYTQFNYLMPIDLGRVHGEDGALIYGTVTSINCLVVVLFTPGITRLTRGLSDPKKTLAGVALVAAGLVLFPAALGHVPLYYVSMLLFTWGEIFTTIAEGPYLTGRIPASHRGRIVGFRTVLTALMEAASKLAVGRVYDRAGSVSAWLLVYGLTALSVILFLWLIARDRKAYPGLYSGKNSEISS